jgi:hypothetical protein
VSNFVDATYRLELVSESDNLSILIAAAINPPYKHPFSSKLRPAFAFADFALLKEIRRSSRVEVQLSGKPKRVHQARAERVEGLKRDSGVPGARDFVGQIACEPVVKSGRVLVQPND